MKTAVEKFIEQLEDQGDSWENVSIGRIQISIKVEDYLKLKEQAKEMEREQIKSAFTKGDLFAEDYFYPEKPNIDCSENYYNETFKSLEMKKDSNKVTWESPIQAGRFRFKNTKDK